MRTLFQIDWAHLLVPTVALGEIMLRGSLVYLLIFALMRVTLKREAGSVALPDLLMVVLIADAAQNAMATEYRSITEGLVLVATIIGWNYALDWLAQAFPRLRPVIHPPPLPLVQDGRLLRQNMRKEFITEEELMSQLRQQGCEELSTVKKAYIEGDGRISVIRMDEGNASHAPRRQSGQG
jgi:uncharacterized membrane protein YcaP (DUF421 family)